jgi:hypothetical protein
VFEPLFGRARLLFRALPLLNPAQVRCFAVGCPLNNHPAHFSTLEGGLTMQVFQSRWGFHPCDYQLFLKLKRIHKAYWEGLRKLAAWQRWHRKLPANRVIGRWHRDDAGRKIRREIIGPQPEPAVPAIYREICGSSISIAEEFQKARHGRAKEEVTPLRIPAEVIKQWFEEVKKVEG